MKIDIQISLIRIIYHYKYASFGKYLIYEITRLGVIKNGNRWET